MSIHTQELFVGLFARRRIKKFLKAYRFMNEDIKIYVLEDWGLFGSLIYVKADGDRFSISRFVAEFDAYLKGLRGEPE